MPRGESGFGGRRPDLALLARCLTVVLATIAVALFLRDALALFAYPFDWDPGEGLLVEAAIRWRASGLSALYPNGDVVPAPFTYGPLEPVLLAMLAPDHLLLPAARLVGLGFALASSGAVYALVRGNAPRSHALAFAALALVPMNRSYYLVLARVDAAMIACWLWGAVFLLPARLASGGGRLGVWRASIGAALLVLAVLAKPSAVIIGAPLVLGWLLVDWRSAVRAGLSVLLLGSACFVALQVATGGGFWQTMALQTLYPRIPGQTSRLILGELVAHASATALLLVAVVIAARRRDGSGRDGAWLLWLAGPVTIPMLGKSGAIFVYLLPWAMGQVALVGRLMARGQLPQPGRGRWLVPEIAGAAPAAVLALLLALRGFPLPTPTDQRTAETFYGFIASREGPMLAVHPDLAYVYAREPVLLEMGQFPNLWRNDLPGARRLLERLDRQEFKTLVENLDRWSLEAKGYAPVGGCELRYHYGRMRALLLVPAREARTVHFRPQAGSRCLAYVGGRE